MTELRAKARKSGVYLRVLKNTLARRAVERRAFDGAARKGVLEDAQVHAGLARFRAQLGHAAHFQTTVLSDDDRFGLRQLRGDFGDYRLLPVKIETQGLPPFVKAAGQKGPRRPRRPCIQD